MQARGFLHQGIDAALQTNGSDVGVEVGGSGHNDSVHLQAQPIEECGEIEEVAIDTILTAHRLTRGRRGIGDGDEFYIRKLGQALHVVSSTAATANDGDSDTFCRTHDLSCICMSGAGSAN
jgi:hypothetical protein